MNDMRKFMKLVESVPFGGGEMCIDCRGMGTNERGEECERCEGFGEVYDDDPQHSSFYDADEYVDDWTCKECGSPNIPEEKDHCPVCGSSWDEQNGFAEDCDETPEQGEDGECSPFTHADDNVDMVREDDFEEDFLIPPKDAKYDDVDEEDPWAGHSTSDYANAHPDDDDWMDRDAPELDRQTDFDAPPRDDGYDLDEQGPGDDEDDFDFDDDAMVDVGDDEDYEVFDFDDEFERMMGNTNRFETIEINALRKLAGLKEGKEGVNWKDAKLVSPEEFDEHGRRKITKDDILANGGVIYGHEDEITGGGGTSSRRDGSEFVEMRPNKGFPRFDKWWEEDPEDIMSMIYWRKDQLPPSGEAFDREWAKVKANLQKKYPAPELTEEEGSKCVRCRKGTMHRGETFFGPAEQCDHCNYQRQLKESTDSRDDYVAFTFDDEKAYFLVADECGEMMEFGMQDEVLLPDQWVDQVLVLLKDHGFEKGRDFSVAGMEEDLQNGYNDQRMDQDDGWGADRFPQGATSSPARELGPAGAKHGDNPMRTPMASVDKEEDDIYESYKHQYRRFRRK